MSSSQAPNVVPTGRGDRRTKKGKRNIGSFGNSRPRNSDIRKKREAEPKSEQQKVADFAVLGGLTGLFFTLARYLDPRAIRAPTATLDPSEFGRLNQQKGYRRTMAPVMAVASRRKAALDATVDVDERHELSAGVALAKEKANAKFDETMEFHARLGLDPKYNDQQLRTTVSLPKGTGKAVSIGVLCEGADAQAALDAGAQKAGMEELLDEIATGKVDFDVLLAVPAAMPKLARFGKILGPKGLMPSPKAGTVTTDVAESVKDFMAGKVEIRTDKQGNIHVPIGKASFSNSDLDENLAAVVKAVEKNRPSGAKGKYWVSGTVCSTMGPAVKLDLNAIKAALA
jgi:large subunit ribosomal protein L1